MHSTRSTLRLGAIVRQLTSSGDHQSLRVGAHRGAMSHAPENTLAAFETAISMGVYRIECDVRQTADGHLVLMHDDTVDRTTNGTGSLRELTLEQVRELRAVTGAGGGTGSEPVPTLEEALRCAKGRCKLLVELKDTDIAEATVSLIEACGMTPDCTISTFHEDSLRICREVSDSIGTCYFMPGSSADRTISPAALASQLGVTLVCVVGGERLALGDAAERDAAAVRRATLPFVCLCVQAPGCSEPTYRLCVLARYRGLGLAR
jgi:glycerophosphoryl diester phosphodiesterase